MSRASIQFVSIMLKVSTYRINATKKPSLLMPEGMAFLLFVSLFRSLVGQGEIDVDVVQMGNSTL